MRVETTTALPDVCAMRFTEAEPDGTGQLTIIDNAKFKLGAPVTVKLAEAVGGRLAARSSTARSRRSRRTSARATAARSSS